MILLKRMAFKGKQKIQDLWEDSIYHVEGQPYAGLPVFRIIPIAGEGKVEIVHQNLFLPFGGNIEGGSENEGSQQDVDGPRIASWQSLMMGFQRLKLCQQILNLRMRVMQSMCSVYELWKSANYWVKIVWGWVKSPYWHQ